MVKLYEIANEYAELANSDMDAETIADTLEGIEGEFSDKAEQILAIIKNEQAQELALKAEAKSLTDRAKASANRVEKLKHYLATSMETMDSTSIAAGIHKLIVRKGMTSVQIDDLEKLPPQFVEYKTEIKADKNLIKEKLKLGESIEGATLVIGKSTLLIK